LTDLPNRRLYSERLERALSLAERNNWYTAVMFLDMDNFKTVNDTLGHEKGDEFIQAVAKCLKSCLRESDTVARFGGDEFVFVLVNIVDAENAAIIAEKILQSLYDLFHSADFPVEGVSASIGISLAPQDGDNPRRLLKHADEAMYRVKQSGKGAYGFYS
jgi:diguanylate cyclase (GGDEF)-like protein